MHIDTITYAELSKFENLHIVVYGMDKNTENFIEFIVNNHSSIVIDYIIIGDDCLQFDKSLSKKFRCVNFETAHNDKILDNACVFVANSTPLKSLNTMLEDTPAVVYLVSRTLHSVFHPNCDLNRTLHAEKSVLPFYIERGTPRVPALISNGYQIGGPAGNDVFELADFERQEYTIWTAPSPSCPLSLGEFSRAVPLDRLPLRMAHPQYCLWKRSMHVAQLSPSKRWLVGARYNFFFLDVLNTETGELFRWHDLPPEDGLWDYVATGDFDGDKDEFLFVRWPVSDAISGMNDGSNKVHCQVGRLHLNTLKADILYEFDFQDRIHQCTISGDGRFMVFAPMRVLRPGGDPKKLKQEEIMRNLQETVVLDDMATLDLQTGQVWRTRIPYPIPAHFELDPFDPRLFYVSTHSLMPHADGVLCFQPGTLHKMRIQDGETVIEDTYSHPGFIRTTQHCVFAWKGNSYIAATNQNKLEIINAKSMKLWHCHKIADDPFYDNANFSDPEFLKKPFNLPPQPAWCDSVSASGDGEFLVLHLTDKFCLFSMADKKIVGSILYRDLSRPTSHCRYWMQNASADCILRKYGLGR